MADMASLIWMQFRGHCFYCKHYVDLLLGTADHFVPRSKGGRSARMNTVLACEPCNQGKADLDPREYGLLFPTAITAAQRHGLQRLRDDVVERSARFRLRAIRPVVDGGEGNDPVAEQNPAVAWSSTKRMVTADYEALARWQGPVLDAYSIEDGKEGGEAVMLPIGAAWATQSGVGFNLLLGCFPVDGRVLLLPHQDDPKGEGRA